MDDLSGGHDGIRGEIGLVHILNDPFGNSNRRPIQGNDFLNGSVIVVGMLIERRNIHSGNFGDFLQKFTPCHSLPLCAAIAFNDLYIHVLAFTDDTEIQKICHWFGVVNTGASCKNHMLQRISPVLCLQRNMTQFQHVQHIGVCHFIADGECDQVKILHGVMAFQRPDGKIMLTHFLLHIAPGCKHPLTPYTLHIVHNAIENAKA